VAPFLGNINIYCYLPRKQWQINPCDVSLPLFPIRVLDLIRQFKYSDLTVKISRSVSRVYDTVHSTNIQLVSHRSHFLKLHPVNRIYHSMTSIKLTIQDATPLCHFAVRSSASLVGQTCLAQSHFMETTFVKYFFLPKTSNLILAPSASSLSSSWSLVLVFIVDLWGFVCRITPISMSNNFRFRLVLDTFSPGM